MCDDCGLHDGLFASIDAEPADESLPWKIWEPGDTTQAICESTSRQICKDLVRSLSRRGKHVILESPNGHEYHFRPVNPE